MNEFITKIKENKELCNGILIVEIILGIILVFRYLLPIVVPFFIAFIIASILRPMVDWLINCKKVSEKWASLVVMLLVGGMILLLGKYVLTALYRQMESFVVYLPFYKEQFMVGLGNCCSYIDTGFHLEEGAAFSYATETLLGIFSDFRTTVLPKLTTSTVAALKQAFSSLLFVFIMLYATLCILKNYHHLFQKGKIMGYIRQVLGGVMHLLGVYVRAEGIIALVQAVICGIGLWILKNPYFILLALLIGMIDAFPVFGSGTILVPWAVYRLLIGDIRMSIGLFVLYLLCTLNRQLLEPRLLGQKLGMSTLLTLFLMYTGYRLFGIFGFLLGPVGYLMGREVFRIVNEKNESEKPNGNLA